MHVRFRVLLLALVVAAVFVAGGVAATSSGSDASANYIVLYKSQAVPKDASSTIANAGGSLVYAYDQIGVAIARSDNASFRANLLKDTRIDGASATASFATQLPDEQASAESQADLPNAPASDTDPLFPLQWDMQQIHTPQAHAITGGSPSVLVGDIDTGIDFSHPDLQANIDVANSVNCLSGAPVPGTAAQDVDGHGTHTAGTIAAAANGHGIVGVAPNVKVAGIKSGNDSGFFFPEAVICGFMWAGSHHMDVTNNSYFADPFLYNCRNDPVQHAIWKAEQRAIRYAMNQGVTVVAAEGNEQDDLSHPQVDQTSPDYPPGSEQDRAVTNACVVIPTEISGVVGVTATGDRQQVDGDADATDYLKSYYSSYGVSSADVTAPGGDFYYGRSARAQNGLVLSTYPATTPCFRSVKETTTDPSFGAAQYCYLQGTSMASPHVAGIAALIISRFGDFKNPQNGKMRPGAVEAQLQQTADPQPCPTALPLQGAPGTSRANTPYANSRRPSGDPQTCQGGPGHNSWYGSGRADAFNAVANITGNAANNEP
jgi:lantibiotic leader peptide-processing serine protease